MGFVSFVHHAVDAWTRPATTLPTATPSATAPASVTLPVASPCALPPQSATPLAPKFSRRSPHASDEIELHQLLGEELTKLKNASQSRYVICNVKTSVFVPDYEPGHEPPQSATIRRQLPGNRLDLTVVLNVDGREGLENAERWGKTDTYIIEVKHPDGRSERMSGIKAQGLVTTQDISVQLQPGKTAIAAWPTQSAGVAGYGQRLLELTYAPPRNNSTLGRDAQGFAGRSPAA